MVGSAKSRLMLALLFGIVSSRPGIAQTTTARRAAADSTHALLRPGDIVRLRIWREPDLSGDFPVDESGTVTFPKLGPFQVSDYNAATLKAKLLDSYAQYLRNPSVEVTMLRRINVLGA